MTVGLELEAEALTRIRCVTFFQDMSTSLGLPAPSNRAAAGVGRR